MTPDLQLENDIYKIYKFCESTKLFEDGKIELGNGNAISDAIADMNSDLEKFANEENILEKNPQIERSLKQNLSLISAKNYPEKKNLENACKLIAGYADSNKQNIFAKDDTSKGWDIQVKNDGDKLTTFILTSDNGQSVFAGNDSASIVNYLTKVASSYFPNDVQKAKTCYNTIYGPLLKFSQYCEQVDKSQITPALKKVIAGKQFDRQGYEVVS